MVWQYSHRCIRLYINKTGAHITHKATSSLVVEFETNGTSNWTLANEPQPSSVHTMHTDMIMASAWALRYLCRAHKCANDVERIGVARTQRTYTSAFRLPGMLAFNI